MNLPQWPGWHLIGRYESDVGSWLLHDQGEALLLEIPEGLTVAGVQAAVKMLGVKLRYVTASHDHWDHLDRGVWGDLAAAFPRARFIHPAAVRGDRRLLIGGEEAWLVAAPKHSLCDVVAVFRGVAMTGDIESGTLDSVTNEVPLGTRRRSMRRLAEFPERSGHQIHATISAHLNSVREDVDWASLYTIGESHA